jgi:hypothetical protein
MVDALYAAFGLFWGTDVTLLVGIQQASVVPIFFETSYARINGEFFTEHISYKQLHESQT